MQHQSRALTRGFYKLKCMNVQGNSFWFVQQRFFSRIKSGGTRYSAKNWVRKIPEDMTVQEKWKIFQISSRAMVHDVNRFIKEMIQTLKKGKKYAINFLNFLFFAHIRNFDTKKNKKNKKIK